MRPPGLRRGVGGLLGRATGGCRGLGQAAVQTFAQLVGIVVLVRAALACDDDPGGGYARDSGDTDDLPSWLHGRVG
ncbi:MAG: hypothetical protein ABSH51_22530 [Solirubrobacteraceae bacterium]